MARQTKKLIQEVTQNACEEAFADYNACISDLQVLEGKMNAEITRVKEKYESRISLLQAERDDAFEVMQAWAEYNPDRFADKKSLDFTHGTIGFRTGMPKLSLLRGFKWPAVLQLVKQNLPAYVRVKEDVDKERMLADRNAIDLKRVGVCVEQDETFFVQPRLEEVAQA
jgi:phage host-nuclease inhibitor protein Gam